MLAALLHPAIPCVILRCALFWQMMADEAQMMKQMTLCHGPAFDLLAITSYKLQQAARSGNLALALAQVRLSSAFPSPPCRHPK